MTAHIRYFPDLHQGSDEWHAARCGMLTASEMPLILTPKLKAASNEKERGHLYELLAQRATGYVEPQYISDAMLRGHEDEIYARDLYGKRFAPVAECGFCVNTAHGFPIGCSPDGLVGDDGMIECKSRRQKFQAQTLVEGVLPEEFAVQVQTALLVTGRAWCDFLSYCGGMPMFRVRVFPDDAIRAAIIEAATAFEERLAVALTKYHAAAAAFPATERRVYEDIIA